MGKSERGSLDLERLQLATEATNDGVFDWNIALGTLSACVGHEINAPLASAIGCLDVAAGEMDPRRGRPIDEARLADAIAVAREALLRVQEIARDLHSLSRFDAESRTSPVDVRVVLDGALRLARREIEQRATLERCFGDVVPVAADPARLGQVFLNLLVNAAHAIPPGAPEENQIEVATSMSAGRVLNGAAAASPAPARRRILIVDDEPGMCLSLRLLLGATSEVVTATSAATALRAVAAGPPFDVILCDLMMPGGSGQDLHRQLSKEHPAQAQAMIFMTGGVLSAETQAFLDEIPNPVLFKPFEVERLEAVLLSSRA